MTALAVVAIRFKLAPSELLDIDPWALRVYYRALELEADASGR